MTYGDQAVAFIRERLTELGVTSLGRVQGYQLSAWLTAFEAQRNAQAEINFGVPEQIHKTQDAKRGSALATPPVERRDELFEAVCGVCNLRWRELTPSARKPLNSAVSQLKQVGATPDEVRRRALRFQSRYPTATLRPTALARHWPELAVSEADVTPIHAPAPVLVFEPAGWQEWLKTAYAGEDWAESAVSLGWRSMPSIWRAKIGREHQPQRAAQSL